MRIDHNTIFRWPSAQDAPAFVRWRGIITFECLKDISEDPPQYLLFSMSANSTMKLWFETKGLIHNHNVSNTVPEMDPGRKYNQLDCIHLPNVVCEPLFGWDMTEFFPFQMEWTAPRPDERSARDLRGVRACPATLHH